MVVLEAMARGVPVVGTHVGGVSDLIQDNATGRLIPAQQPEAFRAAVESLLRQPEVRERLRNKARQEAEQRFRPSVVARQHLEAYASIIERRGGNPSTTS
jgi:glycosyltransferase involved in cell wall biosynthesis